MALGNWTVEQGDAYALAAQLDPQCIDSVVTSPPYWGMRTYDLVHNEGCLTEWLEDGHLSEDPPDWEWYRDRGGVLGLEPYPGWFVAHLVEIFAQIEPALNDRGSLWVNLGDTYFARWSSMRQSGRQGLGQAPRDRRRTPSGGVLQDKQLLMIPARFAIAMQEAGWILRNDVIWSKPNVGPRPEKDRLRSSHEHFFHFVKRAKRGRASYYYDITAAEPGALDVITVPVSRDSYGHTATFPTELVEPRIRTSCPPGGTVLDPFCGSGTTLAAAVAAGRDAVGFDVSDPNTMLSKQRLEHQMAAR